MKNSIFGGIVSLTICGVIFAILCVTDVINFGKTNNTNNPTTKDNLICKTTKKIGETNYNLSIYNTGKTSVLIMEANGTHLTSVILDLINFDEKMCKEILSSDLKRSFISEDKYYNYFLYTLPNDRLLIIKGDKSDKYFSLVLDLDYDYQYGIVNYDKLNNYTDSDVKTINTFIVKDNHLYEYNDQITVYEYIYEFKDNNYTKTQTNNLYYCVAGCKS